MQKVLERARVHRCNDGRGLHFSAFHCSCSHRLIHLFVDLLQHTCRNFSYIQLYLQSFYCHHHHVTFLQYSTGLCIWDRGTQRWVTEWACYNFISSDNGQWNASATEHRVWVLAHIFSCREIKHWVSDNKLGMRWGWGCVMEFPFFLPFWTSTNELISEYCEVLELHVWLRMPAWPRNVAV